MSGDNLIRPFGDLCESAHSHLVAGACPWCSEAIVGGMPISDVAKTELDTEQEAIVSYLVERGGRFTEDQILDELITAQVISEISPEAISRTLQHLVRWGVLYRTLSSTTSVYITIG